MSQVPDVIEPIEKALRAQMENRPFVHRMSAAGRCVRARFYHAQGIEPTDEATMKSLVAIARGEDIEQLALALLREGGAPIHGEQSELVIEHGGIRITGHPDALWAKTGGLDVKGTNASGWGWVKQHGPHSGYVDQCQMYMHATKRKWWVILYVNRDGYPADDFPFMGWVVLYDKVHAQEAFERYAVVEQAMAEGKAPPRPYSRRKEFPCAFCAWGTHCWGEYLEEFDQRPADEQVVEDPDLDAIARQYREAKDEEKEVAKRVTELRDALLAGMERYGAKKLVPGDMRISVWTQRRANLQRELIPEDILQLATKESVSEQLRVSPLKKD